MVFAERAETISGGNFHGEYPAKVIKHIEKKDIITSDFFFLSPNLMRTSFIGFGLLGNWCA